MKRYYPSTIITCSIGVFFIIGFNILRTNIKLKKEAIDKERLEIEIRQKVTKELL